MTERKDKEKTKEFLNYAVEQICEERRIVDIINKKPDEIAIALLLSPSTDEAIEMLQAVKSADNIEGSQGEEVREELFRLRDRIQALLRAI